MPNLIIGLKNTPITFIAMSLMLILSFISLIRPKVFFWMMLHPNSVVKRGEYHRLLTSDFVHNDVMHLLFNVITAYYVCRQLELYLNARYGHGSLIFLSVYLVSHFSGIGWVTIRHRNDYEYSVAGASGSILGCMMSFMIFSPGYIALYLPYFGAVKNIYGGLIFILALILYRRRSGNDLVDHELHFFSAIGGILITVAYLVLLR
jgi:membrane associated rhomboid family serine protease